MQLDAGGKGVRRKLIAASCALLGTSTVRAQEDRGQNPIGPLLEGWQIQSALAYYREDGRIQAVEPVISAERQLSNGGELNLNFTFDSLSGSSPNGALPSHQPQTFASPSAKSIQSARHLYTVGPGRLPVDPSYSDARAAGGADWTLPLTRLTRATLGGKFSYEDDFYSATVSVSVEHDFNEKNTTLAVGLSSEDDFLQPIGGTPVALSQYSLFEKTGNSTEPLRPAATRIDFYSRKACAMVTSWTHGPAGRCRTRLVRLRSRPVAAPKRDCCRQLPC